jgi:hypothetical protein
MKITSVKEFFRILILTSLVLFGLSKLAVAAPVVRNAAGANPAAIQAAVDQFRADLGGANNGNGNSFTSGRREINWDGAPDSVASPNNFPFNGFQGRGAIYNSVANLVGDNPFILSADASNPTNAAVRYGDIDPSYSAIFQAFSQERLFVARDSNVMEIHFVIPGTQIPATVSGFGAVLCDVDNNNNTFMEFYDAAGKQLAEAVPQAANNGLSFLGISFNAGERVAKVIIRLGNAPLAAGNVDGQNGVDVVATDDFIYGEPRAIGHHSNDFDGDGTADFAVFRPSSGNWFVLNSGSNTFQAAAFGTNGDVPVDGDFDGDSRADIAVYRPSSGSWFRLNSSNNQFAAVQFGTNGDKPVAGDYDKDGKTDIAVWRPSSGSYFFLRSSNGQFGTLQWGLNGDIPLGAAIAP